MRLRTIVAAAGLVTAVAVTLVGAQEPPAQPVPFGSQKQQLVTSQIQGFNIVLVLGEVQGSGAPATEDLPSGAGKALADMREFLPYKHYRVLDAQWISCCSGTATLSGRLRGVVGLPGPEGAVRVVHRVFAFSLRVAASISNLPVRFVLALDNVGEGAAAARLQAQERQARTSRLQQSLEVLDNQDAALAERLGTSHPDRMKLQSERQQIRTQLAELTRDSEVHQSSSGTGALIDSSFTMDAGETIVVGTSRLGGDKAIIALVTAVRRTGSK